jgi:hypothetical protein
MLCKIYSRTFYTQVSMNGLNEIPRVLLKSRRINHSCQSDSGTCKYICFLIQVPDWISTQYNHFSNKAIQQNSYSSDQRNSLQVLVFTFELCVHDKQENFYTHLVNKKALPLLSIQNSSHHMSGLVCSHSQHYWETKLQSKSVSGICTQWHHTLQFNTEHIIKLSTLISTL